MAPRAPTTPPPEAKIIDSPIVLAIFQRSRLCGPNSFQNRPNQYQKVSKRAARRPKTAQRGPQNGPRGP
eukprot:5955318-Pyramimonas_sp.AAC.1